MRKKSSRWKVEFDGSGIYQIEGFLCIEIESKKTFSENAKIIPCSLFYDVYGDERQNWDPFSHLASRMKVIHVLKQKERSVSCGFPRKSGNDSFCLILSRKKAFEMNYVFRWYQHRNLAQTNAV